MKASLLVYDVPAALDIDNPSGRLRRLGVRINLSCWAVPDDRMPWVYLQELKDAGVSWHVVAFDAGEAQKIAGIAAEAIEREVNDAIKRARKSHELAHEKLGETLDLDRFDRTTERAQETLQGVLDALKEAARGFGLDETRLPLDRGFAQIRTMKAVADGRAAAFKSLVEEVKASQAPATVKTALADDALPHYVAADMAEDNGVDASVLREVFSK